MTVLCERAGCVYVCVLMIQELICTLKGENVAQL